MPALSPIKSPKRPCDYDSPVNEIPDAEPAPKKRKADVGSKSIRNRLTTMETRRANCKRPLQVLREHAKNSTCPYGLQHRLKPHIRFDREFQTTLDQISHRAHTELLALMIKQQENNLAAENQAIKAQQQLLQNLNPVSQHSFQDFDHFARTMRLKYMFAKEQKTSAHPFHVKSPGNHPSKTRLPSN